MMFIDDRQNPANTSYCGPPRPDKFEGTLLLDFKLVPPLTRNLLLVAVVVVVVVVVCENSILLVLVTFFEDFWSLGLEESSWRNFCEMPEVEAWRLETAKGVLISASFFV